MPVVLDCPNDQEVGLPRMQHNLVEMIEEIHQVGNREEVEGGENHPHHPTGEEALQVDLAVHHQDHPPCHHLVLIYFIIQAGY